MNEEMNVKWEGLENELKSAMARLSEAIERARTEIPDAANAINEEYLKMQARLDEAVASLRK